jgi:hypothetical protein
MASKSKIKIRGELSEGMLCSEIELGLGTDATGIMILSAGALLGKELAEALGLKDTILDLSVTPNRPDWLSVIGVAREIAALTRKKVSYPQLSVSDGGNEIQRKTSVTLLDSDLVKELRADVDALKATKQPESEEKKDEKIFGKKRGSEYLRQQEA